MVLMTARMSSENAILHLCNPSLIILSCLACKLFANYPGIQLTADRQPVSLVGRAHRTHTLIEE